jgi:hypothetical protein
MRGVIRAVLVLAAITVGLVVAASPAHAIIYDLTSDHCTGSCGTPPFGQVELIQNGANVNVTVTLFNGNQFVKTGAGDFLWFKFNGTGIVAGDIVPTGAYPKPLSGVSGTFNGDGTGDFGFGIACVTCDNGGGADAFGGPLTFTVNGATIAELTVANANGNVFVADILSGTTGNTGPVDATIPRVPEPATMLLLGTGLVGLAFAARRRQLSGRKS